MVASLSARVDKLDNSLDQLSNVSARTEGHSSAMTAGWGYALSLASFLAVVLAVVLPLVLRK
jgi:hypothetical protein